jgi:transposase
MSKKIQISIPLDIPDVSVLKTEINKRGDYVITVESAIKQIECRECGREIEQSHGYGRWITLRHLAILDHVVWIRIRPKRYQCPYCDNHPTTSERPTWYDRKSPHTRAYDDYLLKCLINSTVEDVSHKEVVGYDAVEGTIARRVERNVNWAEFEELGTIGMDEIALRKGKRDFVLVITTRRQATGRVAILAVLPDRKKESARQFLESIPDKLRATIKTVCTDMWEGYINAVKEFAEAHQEDVRLEIVIDRFHVAKNYRDCVDKLRKQEVRRLKKELSEEQYDEIKGVMWACRKNNANLSTNERQKLRRLFDYAPKLKLAYSFREELSAIFQMPLTRDEALIRLQRWQDKVRHSGLNCFKKFLTTLDNWREEIANYFVKRLNSGFVEGLNNKIKTIKRRCYGLTNVVHLFQRIYLDLEGFRLFA